MMDLAKLNPWNWFKHEEQNRQESQLPITKKEANNLSLNSGVNPLLQLHQDIEQLFNETFNAFGMLPTTSLPLNKALNETGLYRPQLDISGDDKEYQVLLDVPGLSAADVSIEVNGDKLIIKGQKEEEHESKDKQFYRVERSFGSFVRTLSLPDDANSDAINASLKDGVLVLSIPRQAQSDKNVKRIEISS
jgi:HSP20 family protein